MAYVFAFIMFINTTTTGFYDGSQQHLGLFPDFVLRVCQKFEILFILYLVANGSNTRNPEAKLQGSVYLDRTANCFVVSDNIYFQHKSQ